MAHGLDSMAKLSEEVANGLPCRDRRDQWYLDRNILASSPVTRNDIRLTNVHMGLVTLESSSQATGGHLVAEDMVDGVDGSWAQQGRPAGTRQKVQ